MNRIGPGIPPGPQVEKERNGDGSADDGREDPGNIHSRSG